VETAKRGNARMCYGENGTVKFVETVADNVFRHDANLKKIKR
jgi:hypothetical protein